MSSRTRPVLCPDEEALGTCSVMSLLPLDEGQMKAPWEGGPGLSRLRQLYPQPRRLPLFPLRFRSPWPHSEHTHRVQSPRPSPHFFWGSFYLSFKAWLEYPLCEAFPDSLLYSLLLPHSSVRCRAHHIVRPPFFCFPF